MVSINKTIIVNAFHRRAKKRSPTEIIAKTMNHIGPFLCLVNSGAFHDKRGLSIVFVLFSLRETNTEGEGFEPSNRRLRQLTV